jgi:hypothetical protein
VSATANDLPATDPNGPLHRKIANRSRTLRALEVAPQYNVTRPHGVPKDYNVGPADNNKGLVYRPLGQLKGNADHGPQ